MGRKTWEAKNSKKKRSSYKNGLGKKNGKQIDAKKETGILKGTEKWEANREKKTAAS